MDGLRYVINFAQSHLPACRENSKDTLEVKVEDEDRGDVKWIVNFKKKATPTVMPNVFNYSWEYVSIEEKNMNYLRLV